MYDVAEGDYIVVSRDGHVVYKLPAFRSETPADTAMKMAKDYAFQKWSGSRLYLKVGGQD